jgi:hypothetical protein
MENSSMPWKSTRIWPKLMMWPHSYWLGQLNCKAFSVLGDNNQNNSPKYLGGGAYLKNKLNIEGHKVDLTTFCKCTLCRTENSFILTTAQVWVLALWDRWWHGQSS